MKFLFALLLAPAWASAGVLYDVATRPVDLTNVELASPTAPRSAPVVTPYAVEDGKVRVGGPKAKFIYVFQDRTMYVIDNTSRTVHVLKHATLSQVAAHYADSVNLLEAAAARAAPDDRAEAERKASDMKEVSDRVRQPVAHDFKETARFESVDGHACRIWEEREAGTKRLEVCVAPAASIQGGGDILSGMKTMSQFREGSEFALGVDFGLSEWWPDVETLGGVPLLVREYKYDAEVSEVMISGMHPAALTSASFQAPDGYQVKEGPDYAMWYVR